eukprot:749677-Rhodomonas_salina.1
MCIRDSHTGSGLGVPGMQLMVFDSLRPSGINPKRPTAGAREVAFDFAERHLISQSSRRQLQTMGMTERGARKEEDGEGEERSDTAYVVDGASCRWFKGCVP